MNNTAKNTGTAAGSWAIWRPAVTNLTAYNYTNIGNSVHSTFSYNQNWHIHMLKIVEFHGSGDEHVAVMI